MTTYQVFDGNNLVADNVSIDDARKHLKAGAREISGGLKKKDGVEEYVSVFKLREGGRITIIQKTTTK